MADYVSKHTGIVVDEAVDKVLGGFVKVIDLDALGYRGQPMVISGLHQELKDIGLSKPIYLTYSHYIYILYFQYGNPFDDLIYYTNTPNNVYDLVMISVKSNDTFNMSSLTSYSKPLVISLKAKDETDEYYDPEWETSYLAGNKYDEVWRRIAYVDTGASITISYSNNTYTVFSTEEATNKDPITLYCHGVDSNGMTKQVKFEVYPEETAKDEYHWIKRYDDVVYLDNNSELCRLIYDIGGFGKMPGPTTFTQEQYDKLVKLVGKEEYHMVKFSMYPKESDDPSNDPISFILSMHGYIKRYNTGWDVLVNVLGYNINVYNNYSIKIYDNLTCVVEKSGGNLSLTVNPVTGSFHISVYGYDNNGSAGVTLQKFGKKKDILSAYGDYFSLDDLKILYGGNTTAFTPALDYDPATKLYVDSLVGDIESVLHNINN